jgi:hypothetical protein
MVIAKKNIIKETRYTVTSSSVHQQGSREKNWDYKDSNHARVWRANSFLQLQAPDLDVQLQYGSREEIRGVKARTKFTVKTHAHGLGKQAMTRLGFGRPTS